MQVSYLHTEAEVDQVIAEESTSGRLVVLEVGTHTHRLPTPTHAPTHRSTQCVSEGWEREPSSYPRARFAAE